MWVKLDQWFCLSKLYFQLFYFNPIVTCLWEQYHKILANNKKIFPNLVLLSLSLANGKSKKSFDAIGKHKTQPEYSFFAFKNLKSQVGIDGGGSPFL